MHARRGAGHCGRGRLRGSRMALEALKAAPGVEDVVPIAHPFKLVSKQTKSGRTQVDVGGVIIGGEEAVVIAGPCSVNPASRFFPRRTPLRLPAQLCCAAALTSRVLRRMIFRDSASKHCVCCGSP